MKISLKTDLLLYKKFIKGVKKQAFEEVKKIEKVEKNEKSRRGGSSATVILSNCLRYYSNALSKCQRKCVFQNYEKV